MSKITKLALALSCFLPLFFIFGIKNLCAVINTFSNIENVNILQNFLYQNNVFYFNAILFTIWIMLFFIGICGIKCFTKTFLKAKKMSKEIVVLDKAENITAEHYFTYFSLFVLSFFEVNPTHIKDILVFLFIMILIIWVYIANDMYFVNPILNFLGYKSFSITYHKFYPQNSFEENQEKLFEIKVFTNHPLNRMINKKVFVVFSPHDFSVCYEITKNNM